MLDVHQLFKKAIGFTSLLAALIGIVSFAANGKNDIGAVFFCLAILGGGL